MTKEQLKQAKEIEKKLCELDGFIYNASRLWTGKLQVRKPKMFLMSNGYGAFSGSELELDNELKNEVLQVIEKKRETLQKEFEKIG